VFVDVTGVWVDILFRVCDQVQRNKSRFNVPPDLIETEHLDSVGIHRFSFELHLAMSLQKQLVLMVEVV
jgi:hypothetical protein